MAVLDSLEPRSVFTWFERISTIPRASHHTRAISDWCFSIARDRGLRARQDAAGNVVIFVPASQGYEQAPPMIVQGHLDMVCEKEPSAPVDMARQGVKLLVEGDYIRADGTTLGGDDGIAVAMALALLDSPFIPHPPLELVLTTDEEVGMLGATALDVSDLRGRQLLNLDSEIEGVFTVGCAGGCVASCSIPITWGPTEETALRIRLTGLTGGHSGTEIHHGRANALILLGRMLLSLSKEADVRLVRLSGGTQDNAIPTTAEAEIVTGAPANAWKVLERLTTDYRREFFSTDPGIQLEISEALAVLAMDRDSTRRVLRFLTEAPNGVQAMSRDIAGMVRTSLNLGTAVTGPSAVDAAFCVRSNVSSDKEELVQKLARFMATLGGTVGVYGDYPPFEYQADSPLLRRCEEVFRDLYRCDPKIKSLHAGLECGIFHRKIPGLDCVSLGPDILDIHTPRERMSITSVQRVWLFLLEVLKRSQSNP